MNLEKAKKEFEIFANQYDLENERIKRKFGHSFRVMNNSGMIAEYLNLSEEKKGIAQLIGLLHDIGRFEQEKIYKTFKDSISIDHGDLGVEILKKDDYIRKYITQNKYDNIILKAIKNHNKLFIENGLSEQEMLFAKIIRDADKLDIFYEGVEMFWLNEEEINKINNSKISRNILEAFEKHISIDKKYMVTETDEIIGFISFIYDINFKYDFEIIKKENYINKILDKFEFIDKKTKEQMQIVRKIANEYIERKD